LTQEIPKRGLKKLAGAESASSANREAAAAYAHILEEGSTVKFLPEESNRPSHGKSAGFSVGAVSYVKTTLLGTSSDRPRMIESLGVC